MLNQLIAHNDDIKRLQTENYHISFVEGNLVISGIPYVNKDRKVLTGTIYCPVILSGNKATPQNHTVRFVGEHPCDQFGNEIKSYVNKPEKHILTSEIVGEYFFSSVPASGRYPDFYAKMKKYIDLLSAPAKSIDPSVDAKNFDFEGYNDIDSPFSYPDSNSASAEIVQITNKLKGQKIAIVGLGGSGSYLLDFISKTPVKQISLFDGDVLINKNAFRCPGVVAFEDLSSKPNKAEYYKTKYSQFHKGVEAFDDFLNQDNVNLLGGYDFVFISIDKPKAKKPIIDYLLTSNIPFIDVGMGLSVVDSSIRGQIRSTLITPENNSQILKIQVDEVDENDVYSSNIQTAELNALNAILAIIKWKKYFGFYSHSTMPYNNVFIIDTGSLAKNEA